MMVKKEAFYSELSLCCKLINYYFSVSGTSTSTSSYSEL
jgi:hypothetical protein